MERYGNLDLECDGGGVSQKASLFGGMFKKSSKSGEPSAQAQDNVSISSDQSSDGVSDGTKEKGVFKGMFKKTTKGAKDDSMQTGLTLENSELSTSTDSLTDNKSLKVQDKAGMFGGILKRSPKPGHNRTPSQDTLDTTLSTSNDSLSENNNNKETSGGFSGMFKKAPRLFGARTKSQEDLCAAGELSASNDDLSESSSSSSSSGAKDKGGLFSGVFKKPKLGAKSQSQDDLCANSDLSGSADDLSEKSSKGGVVAKILKNPFSSSAQDKEKSEESSNAEEKISSAEKPKTKQNGFGGLMKSAFHMDKREKSSDSDDEETQENAESQPAHKQNKLAGAMTKLNPFRSANKSDKQTASDDEEPPASGEKPPGNKQKDAEETELLKEVEEKPTPQVRSNLTQKDGKDRSETPPVPPRPTEEIVMGSTWYVEEEQRGPEDSQTNVKKHKNFNPFVPRAAAKASSDDEGLKEDESSAKEENKDEKKPKAQEPKVKKPKRHNPFMPRVKGRTGQKNVQDGAAENEGGKKSLFDQLEEFRTDPSQPEEREDFDRLMEWWRSVEKWEDTPQVEDMTEKEEAKAFAVTADKVQKGIRVFNKLFSERAESLWQHVIDLNAIADGLDKFNKNTKIAQITGGSTSAIGGVATIAGLALAPVTMGTSLIVTAVGLGVATAGSLTTAGAGISNQVNNTMDRKKVEKIVEDYQEKMVDLNKCLKFIKQGIENLRRFDLIKMRKHAYNRDFPVLSSSFYEDGAMAGKAILVNANEIMRVVQIANVAGSTAARAVQIASMATGVLTGLFVGMDIYFVAKDSKILKKGAKSEFAAKIREVATQLHEGLVELNAIREELQCTTTPENGADNTTAVSDFDKKEKEEKQDSSEEDEIDRIKKAIKKDLESREDV